MATASSPSSGEQPDGRLWRDEEDWAIIDSAPDFTVGEGTKSVTFWTALAASSVDLCQRSASECEQRAVELDAQQRNATLSVGPEPRVLEDWTKLADGRITGRLGGRIGEPRWVWLTVAMEGRLPSDPRAGAGYVEAVGGAVYELGAPAREQRLAATSAGSAVGDTPVSPADVSGIDLGVGRPGASPGFGDDMQRGNPLERIAARRANLGRPSVLSLALVGSLGYLLGYVQDIEFVDAEAVPMTMVAPSLPVPPPPSPPSTAAERASLTVSEQRARQELKVESDRRAIEQLRADADKIDETYDARLAALKARVQRDAEQRVAREQQAVDTFDQRASQQKTTLQRRLANAELKLKADEEGLVELRRVEAQRGGGARAVQLGVFPAADDGVPQPQQMRERDWVLDIIKY